jgi:preprotein translocase subunit Sss1
MSEAKTESTTIDKIVGIGLVLVGVGFILMVIAIVFDMLARS